MFKNVTCFLLAPPSLCLFLSHVNNQDPNVLRSALPALRKDKEVVLAAVSAFGACLEYASDELKVRLVSRKDWTTAIIISWWRWGWTFF